MTADSQTRDWVYKRFLEEAPELLGTIEQNLLTLCTEQRNQNVHSIMRATHTLKGAASTVGLETIASVTHAFEDIVQCFSHRELTISVELFSMLLECFDRLRCFITAKLTEVALDDSEISQELDRLFEQLREKLGSYSRQQHCLDVPLEQNGFDLVQSIFEVGIQQRLEVLAKILLKSGDLTEIESTLRSELKLLVSLADSLNLPGFKEIAQTALNALEIRPQEALTIARVALDNLLEGQEQVLAGDRHRGGEPSPGLLLLAQVPQPETNQSSSENIWEELDSLLEEFSQDTKPTSQEETFAVPEVSQSFDGNLNDLPMVALKESGLTHALKQWDNDLTSQSASPPQSDRELEKVDWLTQSTASDRPPESLADEDSTPATPSSESTLSPTVKVKLEGLGRIDRSVNEIQNEHNRQLSENETLQSVVQSLLKSQQQHQQTIDRLHYWAEKFRQDSSSATARPTFQNQKIEGELKFLAQKALAETENLQSAIELLGQSAKNHQQTTQKQQRLVSDLQENLIETRMVRIGEVLKRFTQTVRQLEIVHLKPVHLKLEGTNILLESAIAEKLYPPLLHLIRNAFDHGIEPTEVRQHQGKSAIGQIEIRAYQQGWQTVIEVKDDGQGLDFDRIRDRAVALNLFTSEAASQLSTQQLSNLLFEPGFSTSLKISELSGRGIGLEAVKTEVEALGGTCTVQSQPYQGTTFSLRFPMTLTIVKLTSVRAGKRFYALLSDTIEKILLPDASQMAFSEGKKFLSYSRSGENLLVPVHKLSELIAYQSPICESNIPEISQKTTNSLTYLLLLRYGQKLVGLEVEQVFNEQKTAIKPFGSAIAPPNYVYGCSIVSQNRLALVIDGAILVKDAQAKQNQQYNALPTFKTNLRATLPAPKVLAIASQRQDESVFLPAPPTILLVDDSIGQRQQTALTLQKAGYRILQAKNGLDAIEQLQIDRQKIQLVVCDIEMPHLNGFEFLSYCRHQGKWKKLPVIMLANRAGRQHRKIALGLGANAYFIRPYIESDFLAAINNALEK